MFFNHPHIIIHILQTVASTHSIESSDIMKIRVLEDPAELFEKAMLLGETFGEESLPSEVIYWYVPYSIRKHIYICSYYVYTSIQHIAILIFKLFSIVKTGMDYHAYK